MIKKAAKLSESIYSKTFTHIVISSLKFEIQDTNEELRTGNVGHELLKIPKLRVTSIESAAWLKSEKSGKSERKICKLQVSKLSQGVTQSENFKWITGESVRLKPSISKSIAINFLIKRLIH